MSADRYQEFLRVAVEYRKAHPQQLLGQAYFNALSQFDHDAAEAIRSTPLDPFFGNEVLPDFRAWLRARWQA